MQRRQQLHECRAAKFARQIGARNCAAVFDVDARRERRRDRRFTRRSGGEPPLSRYAQQVEIGDYLQATSGANDQSAPTSAGEFVSDDQFGELAESHDSASADEDAPPPPPPPARVAAISANSPPSLSPSQHPSLDEVAVANVFRNLVASISTPPPPPSPPPPSIEATAAATPARTTQPPSPLDSNASARDEQQQQQQQATTSLIGKVDFVAFTTARPSSSSHERGGGRGSASAERSGTGGRLRGEDVRLHQPKSSLPCKQRNGVVCEFGCIDDLR